MSGSIPFGFWSITQTARELGLYPAEVEKLVRKGEIPARKVGRRWVIDPADIAPTAERFGAARDAIDLERRRLLARADEAEARVESLTAEIEALRAEIEQLEDVTIEREPGIPYQRKDGRWSVRLECPDGTVRRFVSRKAEPVQADHQRSRVPRYPLSATTRFLVLRRDDYACRYCGRRPPAVVLEVDHIVPVAKGGTDELGNLATACSECNVGKGARSAGRA